MQRIGPSSAVRYEHWNKRLAADDLSTNFYKLFPHKTAVAVAQLHFIFIAGIRNCNATHNNSESRGASGQRSCVTRSAPRRTGPVLGEIDFGAFFPSISSKSSCPLCSDTTKDYGVINGGGGGGAADPRARTRATARSGRSTRRSLTAIGTLPARAVRLEDRWIFSPRPPPHRRRIYDRRNSIV